MLRRVFKLAMSRRLGMMALLCVVWPLAQPTAATASPKRCESGNRSTTPASNLRAERVSCAKARRVANSYASSSTGAVAGWRCGPVPYTDRLRCRRNRAFVSFGVQLKCGSTLTASKSLEAVDIVARGVTCPGARSVAARAGDVPFKPVVGWRCRTSCVRLGDRATVRYVSRYRDAKAQQARNDSEER